MISFLDQESTNRKGTQRKSIQAGMYEGFVCPSRTFASFAVKDFWGLWLD